MNASVPEAPPDILSPLLRSFQALTLEEMESATLLERSEAKYVFSGAQLADLLRALSATHSILEIEAQRKHAYESLYFDTPDMELYRLHHRGKFSRFKIRQRRYSSNGLAFLEIKWKNNKRRTIKHRMPLEQVLSELDMAQKAFIEESTAIDPSLLSPYLWVYYERITLVNPDKTERITFDTGLRFRLGEREASFPGLVIAELKYERGQGESPLLRLMRQQQIPPGGISKYCLGLLSLLPELKQNNFKRKLAQINKIVHAQQIA